MPIYRAVISAPFAYTQSKSAYLHIIYSGANMGHNLVGYEMTSLCTFVQCKFFLPRHVQSCGLSELESAA